MEKKTYKMFSASHQTAARNWQRFLNSGKHTSAQLFADNRRPVIIGCINIPHGAPWSSLPSHRWWSQPGSGGSAAAAHNQNPHHCNADTAINDTSREVKKKKKQTNKIHTLKNNLKQTSHSVTFRIFKKKQTARDKLLPVLSHVLIQFKQQPIDDEIVGKGEWEHF